MRKVKFKLLTQLNLVVVETSARTFGELKAEVVANPELKGKVGFEGNQFIERDTKVSYGAIDDAILPSTDFFFFVSPLNTKSGADTPEILSTAELEEMGYNEIRSLGSKLNKEFNAGIDLTGKRADIVVRVDNYYDMIAELVAESDECGSDYDCDEVSTSDKLRNVAELLLNVAEEIDANIEEEEEYDEANELAEGFVTLGELEAEARAISAKVNAKYYKK